MFDTIFTSNMRLVTYSFLASYVVFRSGKILQAFQ